MNEYIGRLLDLLKARDLAKLIKKKIVNKKGQTQTVYVSAGKAEAMGQGGKSYHRKQGITDAGNFADSKNKKYAIHTKEHAKASLAFFARHHGKYSDEDKQAISHRLVSAAKKHGIKVSDEWKTKVGHKEAKMGQKEAFEKVSRSKTWFKNRGWDIQAVADSKGRMRMAVKPIGGKLEKKSLTKDSFENTGDAIKKLKEYVKGKGAVKTKEETAGQPAMAKALTTELGHSMENGILTKN